MSPSSNTVDDGAELRSNSANPPTFAAFSPQNISGASLASRQRSTIIVHRKSPLLVATPPQVTRALAYSHPFILPLNTLTGLLSWSTDDPWESFLLVAGFWAITLYGRELLLWAGPLLLVIGLMLAMYSRRYSPLSSTAWTGEKHVANKDPANNTTTHHKSLDEIVETLRVFTFRCNLLLEPFLAMTDYLSIQRTPTSATTRPALTTLLIRILLISPIWVLLTLPPLQLLTCRRIILSFGTGLLTWHSRPARVTRIILWRFLLVRRVCSLLTGLDFSEGGATTTTMLSATSARGKAPPLPPKHSDKSVNSGSGAMGERHRAASPGIRFTFILYENQRRWLGLGWTSAMLAYERASWTDEHLNPAPSKDRFRLPEVDSGTARWRWVADSEWKIGAVNASADKSALRPPSSFKSEKGASNSGSEKNKARKNGGNGHDEGGWIYYDNKWNDPKLVDSWGRYTRRRKWYRDAELVEVTPSTEVTPCPTPTEAADLSEDDKGDKRGTSSLAMSAGNLQDAKDTSSSAPSLHPDSSLRNEGGVKRDTNKAKGVQSMDGIFDDSPVQHGETGGSWGSGNNEKGKTDHTTPSKRRKWFGSGTTTPNSVNGQSESSTSNNIARATTAPPMPPHIDSTSYPHTSGSDTDGKPTTNSLPSTSQSPLQKQKQKRQQQDNTHRHSSSNRSVLSTSSSSDTLATTTTTSSSSFTANSSPLDRRRDMRLTIGRSDRNRGREAVVEAMTADNGSTSTSNVRAWGLGDDVVMGLS